jgi:hypothetical protein
MTKQMLYLITLIWLVLIVCSLWWDHLTLDLVVGLVSLCFGIWTIKADPLTPESKRIGYRIIGIVFVLSGIVRVAIALYTVYFA